MKKKETCRWFVMAGALLLAFVLFTALVVVFNVKPIGPQGSPVGFSYINEALFSRIGVHMEWYAVTEWLGVLAILVAFGFAVVGLRQLIRRRSIQKVDHSLLALALFYVLVMVAYILFENMVINYRPIMLGAEPEASYPSSHVMLVTGVMVTAMMEVRQLWPERGRLHSVVDVISVMSAVMTVVGRLASGVHWFTDIVGGLLLICALVTLYWAFIQYGKECRMEEGA